MELRSLALQADSLSAGPQGKTKLVYMFTYIQVNYISHNKNDIYVCFIYIYISSFVRI